MTTITNMTASKRPAEIFSDEQLREMFPQPVSVPLRQQFPELGEIKEFADRVCIFSHDRTVLHGVLSSRYHLVDHGQLLIDAANAIENVTGKRPAMSVESLNKGGRMYATVELADAPMIEVGIGDLSRVQLIFSNAYDGLMRFTCNLGAFRLVCKNGMAIGKRLGGFSVKHFAGTTLEEGLLEDRIAGILDKSAKLAPLWNRWSEEQVQYEPMKKKLEPLFSKKYLTAALDESSFPKTKWQLYNELTEQATHRTGSVARRLEMDQVIADAFYTKEQVDLVMPSSE